MTPEEIAARMTGEVTESADAGHAAHEAFLPSPMVQNHASFLHILPDGAVICVWFGGSLEGKSDISIFGAVLEPGAKAWGPEQRLSDDPAHSEQNPVVFAAPDGGLWLFHTAQPSGNQDECRVRMSALMRDGVALSTDAGRYLDLPPGCFIRAPDHGKHQKHRPGIPPAATDAGGLRDPD